MLAALYFALFKISKGADCRGGRHPNFGLGQIFEFLLGRKFVCDQIQCKFYVRILNAKQIQIFLKNDKVCIAMFANANF